MQSLFKELREDVRLIFHTVNSTPKNVVGKAIVEFIYLLIILTIGAVVFAPFI